MFEPLPAVTVVIRGKTFEVRPLSAAQERAVLDAFPRPVPPCTIRDPERGSQAPRLPDDNDPGYRQELQRWYPEHQAGIAALVLAASEGKTLDGPGGLRAGASALMELLTFPEIMRIAGAAAAPRPEDLVKN